MYLKGILRNYSSLLAIKKDNNLWNSKGVLILYQ